MEINTRTVPKGAKIASSWEWGRLRNREAGASAVHMKQCFRTVCIVYFGKRKTFFFKTV